MSEFTTELNHRLAGIRDQSLLRQLRVVSTPQSSRLQSDGRTYLNFSSNDYLGLANHPTLKLAATAAIEQFGCGSGASRLICGSLAPHHELETALAELKCTEAALSFSSGYAAALGTITALMGKEDVIILDRLVHASIVDAARLSGAKLRVFQHNDMESLEKILQWAAQKSNGLEAKSKVLVVTESIFSMDGDAAPLRELIELKDKFGAWLMLDEAHATGIFGNQGAGLASELGLSERVEIQMGTLGKALGASGGFICGPRVLIDYLINRARSFIFSTAPVPAAAAAATAGVQLAKSKEGDARRSQLRANIIQLKEMLSRNGWKSAPFASPIIPLILGDEKRALTAAEMLREKGIFIPAIRYPSVARGTARLRLTLSAAHSSGDIEQLAYPLSAIQKSDSP